MSEPSYKEFCCRAERELRARAASTLEAAALDQLPDALWHPYGFAVFKLDPIPMLGAVRLHVWPVGLRRERDGHPAIHEHEWHLAGLVLAGTYTDEIFTVIPGADGNKNELYEIRSTPEGQDWFEPTGKSMKVGRGTRAEYVRGEIHCIEAGEFHSTSIPRETFAATLAVTSAPMQSHRSIVGSLAGVDTGYTRPAVTAQDRKSLLQQLADHI